jgi:hypothetical protein
MPFYAAESLVKKTVAPCEPWNYVPAQQVSLQIRHDKQSRQDWYRHVDTKWNFYTAIEAANPNQRISKDDNPPKLMHGFHVDIDVKIPRERVLEVIEAMKIKPAYIETSLGGNVRLVWIFSKPMRVNGYDFCVAILEEAKKWLRLKLLPGVDEGAFTDPTRLLCNGGVWEATGHGPIPENELQIFYVNVGREFRFISSDPAEVPLDLVEAKIKERFPNFSWPSDFVEESQGPSFWVPGSTSAMSAIVKREGMFTFSDHADKQFYSWGDILGVEFIKQHADNAIANATKDIYWDQKNFWRKKNGIYAMVGMTELQNFFRVQCRLSAKPGKSGQSQIDTALDHIYNANHIIGAGPFVFQQPGLMEYMGRPVLNTYVHRAVIPASGKQEWGPNGNFPLLSAHFDVLYDPEFQKTFFLAWYKHLYISAHTMMPRPGQNVFLMGGPDIGKTLTSRAIVGRSVGGFVDGCDHLLAGSAFNSEMYEVPLWCIDDEIVGENSQLQSKFQAICKKSAANQQFKFSKKYEVPLTVDWMGRIFVTTNLDYTSSRMLGPQDNSAIDKTNVFRGASEGRLIFPERYELARIIERELPYFLRWLLDWEPPQIVGAGAEHIIENGVVLHVARHVRFGYRSYQEPSLVDKAVQGSKVAPFKELLVVALHNYFDQNKNATEWRGMVTQLLQLLSSNPLNDSVMRSLRLEQTNRYLELIQREGLIKCTVDTVAAKMRVWVFPRFGDTPPTESPTIPTQNTIK